MCMVVIINHFTLQKVQQYYPIRGHSFLPCDRDFGLIKRYMKKKDRYYTLHEITGMIIECAKPGKFTVKEIQPSDVYDFKNWWSKYYKKHTVSNESANKPRSEKTIFAISTLYHFVYDSQIRGYITAYEQINGLVHHTFQMAVVNLGVNPIIMPQNIAYPKGKVPIKQAKLADVKYCLKWVPEEERGFLKSILNWPKA
uniref:Uncharacterized protein n=1 Tax=Cacopsylla melanoneura TaxID=428564 RepID=A0A8D8YWD2_9HEMI